MKPQVFTLLASAAFGLAMSISCAGGPAAQSGSADSRRAPVKKPWLPLPDERVLSWKTDHSWMDCEGSDETGSDDLIRFARFSAGMALKSNGDSDGAIEAFYSALPARVPPTPEFDEAEDYTTASVPHMAALAIADCLEQAGDRIGCLRFLLLARDKYPYYNYCGNCFMAHMQGLERRISDLEKAIRS